MDKNDPGQDENKIESKPAELEACVDALVADGYEESRAYAICTAQMEKSHKSENLFIGKVRGYASVFGNIDRDGEIVDKGAFSQWLSSTNGKLPYIWMHQLGELPVGSVSFLKEDEKGLYYEAEILNTENGRDLMKAIKSGAVESASFSYDVIDHYEDSDGVTHLKRLNLLEISAVTSGMASNPKAYVEVFENKEEIIEDPSVINAFQAGMRQFVNNLEVKEHE